MGGSAESPLAWLTLAVGAPCWLVRQQAGVFTSLAASPSVLLCNGAVSYSCALQVCLMRAQLISALHHAHVDPASSNFIGVVWSVLSCLAHHRAFPSLHQCCSCVCHQCSPPSWHRCTLTCLGGKSCSFHSKWCYACGTPCCCCSGRVPAPQTLSSYACMLRSHCMMSGVCRQQALRLPSKR